MKTKKIKKVVKRRQNHTFLELTALFSYRNIHNKIRVRRLALKSQKTFTGNLKWFFLSIIAAILGFSFSKFVRLIIRNAVEFFVVGFIILTIVFFLLNSIPGSSSLASIPNEQSKREIMEKYHLSGPLISRFGYYLQNLSRGNLGISTSAFPGSEINDFIWDRFLTSATVGSLALSITLFLGVPAGVFIGMSRSKIVDSASALVISLFISIPAVIFAIFLLIIGKSLGLPYIYSRSSFITWILPALSLSIGSAVVYARYIKTEMNSEINSAHAKFAAIKGVSRLRFVWLHALRPALFPVITFLPFSILTIFLGGLFTEKYFQIPGSGGLFLDGIRTKDINVVSFLVVIYALVTVLAYNIRDILYRLIDPRVVK